MPLTPGKSKAVFSKNISEFHKGKTFAATEKKFGKDRANKQAVAVAYSEQRRSGKGQAMPTKAAMMKAEAKETPADEKKESPAYQRLERKMGVEKHPAAAAKALGKGHSKKVGCGHASCGVGKGCSMGKGQAACGHAGCVGKGGCSQSLVPKGKGVGKGQAKKVGKGSGVFNPSETKEDQIYGESAPDETGKTVNKYGATVRRSGESGRDDYRLRMPVTTSDDSVGGGQARKKVGKGQSAPPDKMPKRKSRGAMPLPGAKKAVSRRHKPPMNRGMPGGGAPGPLAAMGGPPPGLPPMGGGGPSGPPILPGAGVNGTPGLPPMGGGPAPMPRPPQRLPALPSTGGGWGAKGMPPPSPGMGQARKSSSKKAAKGKK